MSDKSYRIAKIVLASVLLVILYLFAQNGRYIKDDNEYYFDKWTKTMNVIDKLETID